MSEAAMIAPQRTMPKAVEQNGLLLQRKCVCGQHTVANDECEPCRKERLRVQRWEKNHAGPALLTADFSTAANTMPPRFDADFTRVQLRTSRPFIQRMPRGESASISTEPTAEETAVPGLLIEDNAADLDEGQMRKSEFLGELRMAVCNAADAELATAGRDTEGCPYLDYWFDYYGQRDAGYIERALSRYAPQVRTATSARDYIPIVAERVRQGVARWVRTGEVSGVPEGVPTAVPGEPPAESSPAVQAKARPGGASLDDDPAVIRDQLGDGRSLDSGVRSRMELAFGISFGHVRLHNDSNAANLSSDQNARAFTVGEHVAFGTGEYQPGTMLGDALIAHELAHIVQQSGGDTAVSTKNIDNVGYQALEKDANRTAVGALLSLWDGVGDTMTGLAQQASPTLKSGLRLQRCSCDGSGCTPESAPSTTATPTVTTGLKSVTNADGKGWLTVKHADGSTYPPLPWYLKVDHISTTGGREHFIVKESGQNGKLIGNKATVKKKSDGGSYLSSSLSYKGAASVKFDKVKKVLYYGGSGPIAAKTDPGNPIPNGTHDIEIPYELHPLASSYESDSKYAQTWFRVGHSGDRFIHPGSVSAGCATVTAVSEWTKIYTYLINSRKDDKNVGTIEVK